GAWRGGWPLARGGLRYARHVLLPAPAACAKVWHWRSAPSRPPRSAPLPGPVLVMKKVMLGDCGGGCCASAAPPRPSDISAADASMNNRVVISVLPSLAAPARARATPRAPPVKQVAIAFTTPR